MAARSVALPLLHSPPGIRNSPMRCNAFMLHIHCHASAHGSLAPCLKIPRIARTDITYTTSQWVVAQCDFAGSKNLVDTPTNGAQHPAQSAANPDLTLRLYKHATADKMVKAVEKYLFPKPLHSCAHVRMAPVPGIRQVSPAKRVGLRSPSCVARKVSQPPLSGSRVDSCFRHKAAASEQANDLGGNNKLAHMVQIQHTFQRIVA